MSLLLEEKKSILSKDIDEIYNEDLLGSHAFCFGDIPTVESIKKYDSFKISVANLLGVHKNDVNIFGSAKIGYSLNPEKELKDFNEDSDIDIAIVSSNIYRTFRDAYLEEFYSGRFKYYKHKQVTSAIFRKFIIFDGFSEKNSEYRNWLEKTGEFEAIIQLEYELNNEINYRIFETWDAVEYYYKKSINECKVKFCENN